MLLESLAVASAAMSAYASYKKNKADRAQALSNQALATAEAAEMRRRSEINQQLMRRKMQSSFEDVKARMAITGVGMEGIESSFLRDMEAELERARTEADYDITSRLMQAEAYGKQASAINRLTPLTVASGALSTGTSLYRIYGSKPDTNGAASSTKQQNTEYDFDPRQ